MFVVIELARHYGMLWFTFRALSIRSQSVVRDSFFLSSEKVVLLVLKMIKA